MRADSWWPSSVSRVSGTAGAVNSGGGSVAGCSSCRTTSRADASSVQAGRPQNGSDAPTRARACDTRAARRSSSPASPVPVRDQVKCVDAPALADSIDAADPLLEPHRIPRELEVDHAFDSAGEGSALRRPRPWRAARRAVGECAERGPPLLARHPAVDDRCVRSDLAVDVQKRVAILGEDDDRLSNRAEESVKPPQLSSSTLQPRVPRRQAARAAAAPGRRPATPARPTWAPRRRRSVRRSHRPGAAATARCGFHRPRRSSNCSRRSADAARANGLESARLCRSASISQTLRSMSADSRRIARVSAASAACIRRSASVHRDADRVNAASGVAPGLEPGPPEHDQVIAVAAQAAEDAERGFVAVVRRGRQQQHVRRPLAQARHRLPPVRLPARAVRLVDDHHVPVGLEHGRQHFRPLDVVDRRDDE